MLARPFSCSGNECAGRSVLAAVVVLLNFLMRHLPAVSQLPSLVFTVWIVFFNQSSTVLFVYPFSLQVPDQPSLYWPVPVWLVPAEGARSFSTCILIYVVRGGCGWTHISHSDPWGGCLSHHHLYPELGWGGIALSLTLQHVTAAPGRFPRGSVSVVSNPVFL